MMRLRALFPLLAIAAAPLGAQTPVPEGQAPPPSGRSFIQRVAGPGKWVAGAASIALIAFAVREHQRSNESWDALITICQADNERCEVASDGAYQDAEAERLYQESLYYDRRAQRRILGGQAALVVTGALLIVDLSVRRDGTNNVPFDPDQAYVAPAKDGGVLLGLRLSF
jgi:hypothetical protein